MKKIRFKLNSQSGFSLVETLMAMLILLMVSSVVVGGIPVAQRAYQKVVESANAQLLLSTAVTEIREELGLASVIHSAATEDGKFTIKYRSGSNGSSKKMYSSSDTGIMLENYIEYENKGGSTGTVDPGTRPLVTVQTSTADLIVTFESADLSEGKITLNDLAVKRKQGNGTLVSLSKFEVELAGTIE